MNNIAKSEQTVFADKTLELQLEYLHRNSPCFEHDFTQSCSLQFALNIGIVFSIFF